MYQCNDINKSTVTMNNKKCNIIHNVGYSGNSKHILSSISCIEERFESCSNVGFISCHQRLDYLRGEDISTLEKERVKSEKMQGCD